MKTGNFYGDQLRLTLNFTVFIYTYAKTELLFSFKKQRLLFTAKNFIQLNLREYLYGTENSLRIKYDYNRSCPRNVVDNAANLLIMYMLRTEKHEQERRRDCGSRKIFTGAHKN